MKNGLQINPTGAAFAVVLAVAAFIGGYFMAPGDSSPQRPPTAAGFVWPPPPPLETFELTDTAGARFDHNRLTGHWSLVFFGYTHCPDICPTTMATLRQIDQKLHDHEPYLRNGQVVFISVDGERDNAPALRTYTDHFNPAFLAASGSREALYQLTGQFGVQIVRVSGDSPDEYWFDHPASILLIGPDRRLAGVFAPPLDAGDIATQVRAIVDWSEASG